MAKEGFLDFDLLIEGLGEGNYRARVLDSPSGTAVEDIRLLFSQLELENFMLRAGRPRRAVRRVETPEMDSIKGFGSKLFKSVFKDEILTVLSNSIEDANKRGKGLRIRLRLNNAPDLVNLPWEFLYNPDLNRFLSLSSTTPVIRYLELPERISPLSITPPLRILVIISSPDDVPQLDVESEWNNLKSAVCDLEERGLLEVERLDEATPSALQYKLRNKAYHILHFIGHGGFDEQAQDGVLIFEEKNNHSRPMSGQNLGTLLHDERTMRLVVLNACEGGRTGTTDPFAGVAQSLVQQGMPAVIAMQFEISDDTAITFAHEFYSAITDGYPVDAAMSEARKAIYTQGNEIEWGTPVLYMRLEDGHVFDVHKEPASAAATVVINKPEALKRPATPILQEIPQTPPRTSMPPQANAQAIPLKPAPRAAPAKAPANIRRRLIWIAGGVLLLMFAMLSLAALVLILRPPRLSSYSGMVKVTTDLYHAQPGADQTLQNFWIDRYEVTNLEYSRYLQQHRVSPPASWQAGEFPAGQAEFPVQGITWAKADLFCKAQGKRLPTQAEWELAARGPFGWQFPWGDQSESVRQELDATLEVTSNASNRSYFGAYYMSGNVGEWVSDRNPTGSQADHLLLGGTFGARDALTSPSHGTDQDLAVVNAGIRCAADQNDTLEKNLHDETLTLDDNFDSPSTNWPKIGEKGDKFIYNYHDPDYYHLEDRMPDTFIPAFYEPVTFHNFVLETEAFVDAKNTDNQQGNFFYGLAVKQQNDQFYAIVVSAKTHEWQAIQGTLPQSARFGSTSDLTIVQSGMQPQIIGASEDKADRLVIIANNTELVYYVNGSLVFRQPVLDYGKRNVGFIAVTLSDITRIHIHFNWVTLQKIDSFDEDATSLGSQPAQSETAMQMQPAATPAPVPTPTAAMADMQPTAVPSPTVQAKTTLLFTGLIMPARCVQASIDKRGSSDYLFDEVRSLLQGADLTIGTLDATLSDIAPHTGCVSTIVMAGDSKTADTLAGTGFDVMNVATHHIMNCGFADCGNRAFLETLANLSRVNIAAVGAGKNLAEAMQPLVKTVNGVRFAFVAVDMMEEDMPTMNMDGPGVAMLTKADLPSALDMAHQMADVVILMPHWGPEESPNPTDLQESIAQLAVQSGANLIVGSRTHVIQADQQIGDVPVFYSLGNFVFDQTFDLAHQQGLILKVTFEGTKLTGYELIPTHVDGDGTVHIAGDAEKSQILADLKAISDKLQP